MKKPFVSGLAKQYAPVYAAKGNILTMKASAVIRNLLFLTLMSFYASCGREDIFDDPGDKLACTYLETQPSEMLKGEVNGFDPA